MKTLLFGEMYAIESFTPETIAHQISKIVPSLEYFDALGNVKNFYGKCHNVTINNLKLASSIMSPFAVRASYFDEITLMIPIEGDCTTMIENKKFEWGEHKYAYLKPKGEACSISRTTRSFLLIDIDENTFNTQAKIMLGLHEDTDFAYDFSHPALIPLSYHRIAFDFVLKQLCRILDDNICDLQKLEKTRFDELFHRVLVMMLMPQKFFSDQENKKIKNFFSTSIMAVIQHVQNDSLFAFMNLTELEKFLGLSTRMLQILFKDRFSITPNAFLRDQKMKYAKALIEQSKGTINITQAAIEVGFFNFSQFSLYYKEQFGELPSATMKRVK